MGRQTVFQFALTPVNDELTPLAQATLHLAEIAEKLADEDRTLVSHRSGRAENVAEHSNMLALIAPALAEQFFREMDANLVARFATIHDSVEAYVGDTPTHQITEAGLQDKAELEAAGLEQLTKEFEHLPAFTAVIEAYEQQRVPEARFVRVLDKCMPALMHIANDGAVLRAYIDGAGARQNAAERAAALSQDYPEFMPLIMLRNELSELIIKRYLRDE